MSLILLNFLAMQGFWPSLWYTAAVHMVLQMARPWKHESGLFYVRLRVPADVRITASNRRIDLPKEAGGGSIQLRTNPEHFKASLRTREPRVAKERNAAAVAHLEAFWRGLRDGPKSLSNRQVTALAGEFYRRAKAKLEDEPGSASTWLHISDMAARWDEATILIQMAPLAEDELARHALNVDEPSKIALAHALHKAGMDVAKLLQRRAEGDYGTDEAVRRFPPLQLSPASAAPTGGGLTTTDLFGKWEREATATGLAEKTVKEYRSVIKRLIAFLEFDDAARVSPADVVAYKDMRLASMNPRTSLPISPKTVKDVDLSALKSVFGWGADNLHLPSNPAEGVKLKLGKTKKERSKGYSDDEAITILRAANAYRRTGRELEKTAAAKQWVPWLCAFTGARVGEVLQLRREDVRREGVPWVAKITPEAGPVKNKEFRDVPLHPQLVELGFVAFVEGSASGYLFLNAVNKTEAKGRLNGAKNRVSEFVRLQVGDTRVRPNHAWRHRLITLGRKYAVDQELRRMITGHAGKGVDEQEYGDPEGLYREICKLPNYELAG